MQLPPDTITDDTYTADPTAPLPALEIEPHVYTGPSPLTIPHPHRVDTQQIAKEIGDNIRRIRLSRNMTQKDVAAALGHRTFAWISAIENGHTLLSWRLLEKIAAILEVPPEDLRSSRYQTPSLDPKIYGPRLRALRKQRGLSQRQLVDHLGVGTPAWISHVENGQNLIQPSKLQRLLDFFEISINDLTAKHSPLDTLPPAPPDTTN